MAYVLSAFLGESEPVMRLAAQLPGCRVVQLPQGVLMVPFSGVARSASGVLPCEAAPSWPFSDLDPETSERLVGFAGPGKIVYVEVEYFGNAGGQSAVGWQDGLRCLGPKTAIAGSVNEAARFLGVRASAGNDEFDTLGLGRHRRTEAW